MSDTIATESPPRSFVVTETDLVEAGFYPIKDHPSRRTLKDWFTAGFQKRFEDPQGTRYFLEVVLSRVPRSPASTPTQFCTPSAQFRRNETFFNIEMLRHHETIEEMQAFFEEMWHVMQCDHYELNDFTTEPVLIENIGKLLSAGRLTSGSN